MSEAYDTLGLEVYNNIVFHLSLRLHFLQRQEIDAEILCESTALLSLETKHTSYMTISQVCTELHTLVS